VRPCSSGCQLDLWTDLRITAGSHRAYPATPGAFPATRSPDRRRDGDGAAASVGESVFVAPTTGVATVASVSGQVNLCAEPRRRHHRGRGFAEYVLLRRDWWTRATCFASAMARPRRGSAGRAPRVRVARLSSLPYRRRRRRCGLRRGPIGLFHVALARLAGPAPWSSAAQRRRRHGPRLGATSVHDANLEELQAALEDAGATRGADAVVVGPVAVPKPGAGARRTGGAQLLRRFPGSFPIELDSNLIPTRSSSSRDHGEHQRRVPCGAPSDRRRLVDVSSLMMRDSTWLGRGRLRTRRLGPALKVVIEP